MRPWSVTNWRSRFVFLKSRASTVKSIFGFGRGVRFSMVPRRPRLSDLSVLVLRGIDLLDLLVQRMPTERGIILFDLQLLRLQLLVTGGGVARRRFPLLAGFRAFNGDDFTRHKLLLLFFFGGLFFRRIVRVLFDIRRCGGIHGSQLTEPALTQCAIAFQLGLGLHRETRPWNRFQSRL